MTRGSIPQLLLGSMLCKFYDMDHKYIRAKYEGIVVGKDPHENLDMLFTMKLKYNHHKHTLSHFSNDDLY
jgi:hypothetical protein